MTTAPSLYPRSRYLEVCESSEPVSLLIEAEDSGLEPSSGLFTFELDTAQGPAGDTGKLGENWMSARAGGKGLQ